MQLSLMYLSLYSSLVLIQPDAITAATIAGSSIVSHQVRISPPPRRRQNDGKMSNRHKEESSFLDPTESKTTSALSSNTTVHTNQHGFIFVSVVLLQNRKKHVLCNSTQPTPTTDDCSRLNRRWKVTVEEVSTASISSGFVNENATAMSEPTTRIRTTSMLSKHLDVIWTSSLSTGVTSVDVEDVFNVMDSCVLGRVEGNTYLTSTHVGNPTTLVLGRRSSSLSQPVVTPSPHGSNNTTGHAKCSFVIPLDKFSHSSSTQGRDQTFDPPSSFCPSVSATRTFVVSLWETSINVNERVQFDSLLTRRLAVLPRVAQPRQTVDPVTRVTLEYVYSSPSTYLREQEYESSLFATVESTPPHQKDEDNINSFLPILWMLSWIFLPSIIWPLLGDHAYRFLQLCNTPRFFLEPTKRILTQQENDSDTSVEQEAGIAPETFNEGDENASNVNDSVSNGNDDRSETGIQTGVRVGNNADSDDSGTGKDPKLVRNFETCGDFIVPEESVEGYVMLSSKFSQESAHVVNIPGSEPRRGHEILTQLSEVTTQLHSQCQSRTMIDTLNQDRSGVFQACINESEATLKHLQIDIDSSSKSVKGEPHTESTEMKTRETDGAHLNNIMKAATDGDDDNNNNAKSMANKDRGFSPHCVQHSEADESYVSTLPPDSDYASVEDPFHFPYDVVQYSKISSVPHQKSAPISKNPKKPRRQSPVATGRMRRSNIDTRSNVRTHFELSVDQKPDPVKACAKQDNSILPIDQIDRCQPSLKRTYQDWLDLDSVEITKVILPASGKKSGIRPYSKSNFVADWIPSNRLQTVSERFMHEDAWNIPEHTPDCQPSNGSTNTVPKSIMLAGGTMPSTSK
jgi:hypothetical protein